MLSGVSQGSRHPGNRVCRSVPRLRVDRTRRRDLSRRDGLGNGIPGLRGALPLSDVRIAGSSRGRYRAPAAADCPRLGTQDRPHREERFGVTLPDERAPVTRRNAAWRRRRKPNMSAPETNGRPHRETVTFPANTPVTLALAYPEPRMVSSPRGERAMYTTADNRVVFVDPAVAGRIAELGINVRESFT